MAHVITALATEGHTAGQVTSQPAADDTGAPLRACRLKSRSCLPFLAAVRTLDRLRDALAINSGHPLIFLELFSTEEFSKLFLASVLGLSV